MWYLKIKYFQLIKPLALLVLFGFTFNPLAALAVPFIDKESELSMGREADKEVINVYGLYQNKPLQLYVNNIGQSLVSILANKEFSKYFFKVVDSSDINAFALPGGYVYVTRGLLATLNNEAELAGVLGHEIAHITQHHGAKQIIRTIGTQLLAIGAAIANPENAGDWLVVSSALFQKINLGYGRAAELESDSHGIYTAHTAGYDPRSMGKFLENLRQRAIMSGQAYHGFRATHPETKERMVKVARLSESIINRSYKIGVLKRKEYLRQIQGLKFGGRRDKNDSRNYKKEFIDLYEVQPGDTYSSIALKELRDETKDMDIAVLNGQRLKNPLEVGRLIKLVRPGEHQKNIILELKPDTL